jgi:murein DD-endopeptidase MepM/ murein hydrolase activator NlpD
LAQKKVTLLLLPGGARRVRQIEVSKVLFFLFPLFILSGALVLATIILDYIAVKREVPRIADLRKENRQQKEQLAALSVEIETVGKSLEELKRMDDKLRTMVNLESRDDRPQFLGIGGSEPLLNGPSPQSERAQRQWIRTMHQSISGMKDEISLQKNEKLELSNLLETQKFLLSSTPSIWPTRGWVSSPFGGRTSPFTEEKEFHSGLDISTKIHSPIVSPADGVVVEAGLDSGYGRILYISHGNGFKTKYAHLDKSLVKVGQRVKRGQEIATVGTSGRTTGPHLHYEVHLNGLPVNPTRYILN